MLSSAQLVQAIRSLGLEGACISLHASYKSLGGAEGGPQAVLDAFLGLGCTLMMPAFSYKYQIRPPEDARFTRNGLDDKQGLDSPSCEESPVYDPSSNEVSAESMGCLSRFLLETPGRQRGSHPVNSFTAAGPHAQRLIAPQTPHDVYAPFQRLCALGGSVLLIGVGLDRATIIHAAEQAAGRKPFIRWAKSPSGEPMEARVGSCSAGFENFAPALQGIERRMTVGGSLWRCFPAQGMIEICAQAIKANPQITHCADAHCARCNDAIAGGPIV